MLHVVVQLLDLLLVAGELALYSELLPGRAKAHARGNSIFRFSRFYVFSAKNMVGGLLQDHLLVLVLVQRGLSLLRREVGIRRCHASSAHPFCFEVL